MLLLFTKPCVWMSFLLMTSIRCTQKFSRSMAQHHFVWDVGEDGSTHLVALLLGHGLPWWSGCCSSTGAHTTQIHERTSPVVQAMARRLFGAKPLPEQMLTYCKLDPREQISYEI